MCLLLSVTAFAADCTFRSDPGEFLSRQGRIRAEVYRRAKLAPGAPLRAAATVPPSDMPWRNLVDAEIFTRMIAAGVPSAQISGDEEFFRRVYLDLAGRLPSPEDIAAFLANPNRDAVIDRLLASPEFADRWTMWFGDLLQVVTASANVNRQPAGRNAYHAWLRAAIAANKPLGELAYEAVASAGTSFDPKTGGVNFAVGAVTPMGPIQDTYDAALVRAATTFLGMGHYDCLLCHDGRGHLTGISLWGGNATRAQAWRMASHFSRLRLARSRTPQGDPQFGLFEVTDAPEGAYALNTNFGNRPSREPFGPDRQLAPEYHFTGAQPGDGNWRAAFAAGMVRDRMFSRNLANRIWKHFFSLALVDPVDTLDPARLDPKNPPPAPWTLQATHPELLEALAAELEAGNFNLRAFIRMLVESNAYQLSSRYGGEWKLEYVPLFARHYPRRLEGEEVHDAIVKATGAGAEYRVGGWDNPVNWAVQLPEPAEPRSNGAAAAFMNSFLRGNRDTQPRSQAGSILQHLNLMNDPFVLNRVRFGASPVLQSLAPLDDGAAIEKLYLHVLARKPSEQEIDKAKAHLARTRSRNAALEDLAWVAINKVEFLFSY